MVHPLLAMILYITGELAQLRIFRQFFLSGHWNLPFLYGHSGKSIASQWNIFQFSPWIWENNIFNCNQTPLINSSSQDGFIFSILRLVSKEVLYNILQLLQADWTHGIADLKSLAKDLPYSFNSPLKAFHGLCVWFQSIVLCRTLLPSECHGHVAIQMFIFSKFKITALQNSLEITGLLRKSYRLRVARPWFKA